MRLAVASTIGVCALLGACAGSKGLPERSAPRADAVASGIFEEVKLPAGFQQVMSDVGPVFADDSGRTLYAWRMAGAWCKDAHDPLPEGADARLVMYAEKAPTCAQQWPPVVASEDAKPIADWSVVTRPDGVKQWAYKSQPLHYSYKDRLAGDVNGLTGVFQVPTLKAAFTPAAPPLKLPPGIESAWYAGVGLVATTTAGHTLYTMEQTDQCKDAKDQDSRCSVDETKWPTLAAGNMAHWSHGPWSVLTQPDNTKVWGFQGRPLHTFSGDDLANSYNGAGVVEQARIVVLKGVAARAPKGVTVNRIVVGPAYADEHGSTLYTFNCQNYTPAAGSGATVPFLLCDNWSDDPALAEQFCEARDKCAERWQPFVAPASATARGGTWSIAVIPDPVKYPLRWKPVDSAEANSPGAIKVWTYEGRPLYTFAGDRGPGDWKGHLFLRLGGPMWSAALAGTNDTG